MSRIIKTTKGEFYAVTEEFALSEDTFLWVDVIGIDCCHSYEDALEQTRVTRNYSNVWIIDETIGEKLVYMEEGKLKKSEGQIIEIQFLT